jgi:hypothetical protein
LDIPSQWIKNQIRRADIPWFQGGFIGSIYDGACTIAFVKAKTGPIRLQNLRVFAQPGIIGKTFEEDSDNVQEKGFLAYPLVEGAADSAPGLPGLNRDEIKVAEACIRGMLEQGKASHSPSEIIRHKENRTEPVFQRIPQLMRELPDIVFRKSMELAPEDSLYLDDHLSIKGQGVVIDATDPKH